MNGVFGEMETVKTEGGYAFRWSIDNDAIADMVREVNEKLDADLFDRLAAERGYRKQDVDVDALLEVAAKLEERAEYGSFEAESAGRIRAAIEGNRVPMAEQERALVPVRRRARGETRGTCAVPECACSKVDEREWARRHCPNGCCDPDRWNRGCWGCEERYDALDMVVPCKREVAG